MKVRQLLRPTYTYSKFIDESHKPCCERTKENREALFDILRENFKSDAKYGTTRLEYEISEMKRGNIPIFYSEFCKNDLFADGRIICPGYYQFSAKETILEKLLHLDETTIKYQERLIAMSIFLHSANLILQIQSIILTIFFILTVMIIILQSILKPQKNGAKNF